VEEEEVVAVDEAPVAQVTADPELTHEQEIAAEAEAIAHVIEDDDMLNLPAPPPETLGRHHRPAPPRGPRNLRSRSSSFKQTMIPSLLVLGVLLPALAGWHFILGDESPIAGNSWIALVLLSFGVVMLAFAILTMLQVRAQLAGDAANRMEE